MRKKILSSITFWILTIETSLIIFLYIIGFRFTYRPGVDLDWTAIGACGQWAGAIVGLLIPVAAVYFQYILNRKQLEISESNILLLEELNEFKKKHEEDIKWLSRDIYDQTHIYDDDTYSNIETILSDKSSTEEASNKTKNGEFLFTNELESKALKYIYISMFANTEQVAKYLDIGNFETFELLVNMLKNDKSITADGSVTLENIDKIIWKKRSKF